MASLNKSTFLKSFLSYLPIIFLFFPVLNEFDFNYLKLDYLSSNFIFDYESSVDMVFVRIVYFINLSEFIKFTK